MARLARLVVPGLPHYVTQRGSGRARTFFGRRKGHKLRQRHFIAKMKVVCKRARDQHGEESEQQVIGRADWLGFDPTPMAIKQILCEQSH